MLATDTNKESWIGLHGEDFKREAEAIITVTKNKYTKMNYIKENKKLHRNHYCDAEKI